MKIAWFTPLDQISAIGKVGLQICEKLVHMNHQVDVWAYETERTLTTSLNVVHYEPSKLNVYELQKYDHVVYNMGNYAGFHWAIYAAMMQFPGILVLHDRTMYNFFQQYCEMQHSADSNHSRQAFLRMVQEEYGTLGEATVDVYSTADILAKNELIIWLPFIRKICEYSKAVFTHSNNFSKEIREVSLMPTSYAYLPCDIQESELSASPLPFTKNPEKSLIVSTGTVHPIKHIRDMVDVLLTDPNIRKKVQYVVLGDCGGPYGEELKRLAETELTDCFSILGYQPNDVMANLLKEADICLNLRYPNSEACSLSLLEQMAYGKPVIVFDSGIFGEMPDDAVYKIQLDQTEKQLPDAIQKLTENKKLRERIGTKAREFIESHCSLEIYCKRLIAFLEKINRSNSSEFYKQALSDLHAEMVRLGFNVQDIPGVMDDIICHTSVTFNVEKTDLGRENTFAVWAAFPYEVPGLHREGIMKLNSRLVEAMMEIIPLNFEIWTYESNYKEVIISFQKSMKRWPDRIKVITENNWKEQLSIPKMDRKLPWKITIEEDNLGVIARRYSEACVFSPVILYLDNVLQIHRPVYVPAMDMSIKYYYEEFTFRDSSRKFLARDIEGRVGRMFRAGMGGYCMSQFIKEAQILPLLQNAKDEDIGIVWTPDMTSICEGEYEFSEKTLTQLGIRLPFLFYPTQFRPNKNIETLMKAFEIVIKEVPSLKLVLTGNLDDIPDVKTEWKKLKSFSSLIFVNDLSEEELFNVYHYSACVPVSTVMEGGFPAQAIEALKMNVPLVLSDTPIVEERLAGCKMTKETCGLALYDPYDEKALAACIYEALTNPEVFKSRQRKFWDVFSQYTWREAAAKHYQLMMKAAGRKYNIS